MELRHCLIICLLGLVIGLFGEKTKEIFNQKPLLAMEYHKRDYEKKRTPLNPKNTCSINGIGITKDVRK